MFKFDVYFRNIEVINNFNWKKSINSFADVVSYKPQFAHKKYKKNFN